MMTDAIAALRQSAASTTDLLAPLLAVLLGAFLIYGVGFAAPTSIHNAAHDTRHAMTFPCH